MYTCKLHTVLIRGPDQESIVFKHVIVLPDFEWSLVQYIKGKLINLGIQTYQHS